MSTTTRSPLGAKLGVVALVLLALAAAWYFGIFAQVAEPRTLAHTLVEMGAWGYLAFIVAYAVLQPFGVPGTISQNVSAGQSSWRTHALRQV